MAAPKARSDDPWEKEKDTIMGSLWFSKVVEPVFIIAIISVSFYFFAYGYYQGFFDRLSFPFNGLDFPITFYLSIGHWLTVLFIAIIFLVIFIYIMWSHAVLLVSISTLFKTLARSVVIELVTLMAFFSVKFIFPVFPVPRDILWVLDGFINAIMFLLIWYLFLDFIILGVQYIKIKYQRFENIYHMTFSYIYDLPILILIVLILPYVLGYFSAGDLIEGRPGNLNVTFEMIDGDKDITNSQFILVMYHNDIYYVVEKEDPAPERATLHIIPGKMVKKATINPIYESSASPNLTEILHNFRNYSPRTCI